MAFTVEHFHDLLRLLEERPEWRAELRRVVLSDNLLRLPEQLAEARLETERRFQTLTERIDALTERMDALTEQVGALTRRVDTLAVRMDGLVTQVSTLAGHVGNIRGDILEQRYRERAYAYFGRALRGAHALTSDELAALLEVAIDGGRLTADEAGEVALADVVVRGRRSAGSPVIHLVVEVSVDVGLDDVRRAVERAQLLARAGVAAFPAVAGEWLTPDALDAAQGLNVWQITGARVAPPENAPA